MFIAIYPTRSRAANPPPRLRINFFTCCCFDFSYFDILKLQMEWKMFNGVHNIVYIFIFISRSKNKRFNIKKQKIKAAKCKKANS